MLLSLTSFWGKPPALLDQMERELQSHFDVQTRLFLPDLRIVSIPMPSLHSPGNRDVCLGGKALRMILFGLVVFLNCCMSFLTGVGVFIAETQILLIPFF